MNNGVAADRSDRYCLFEGAPQQSMRVARGRLTSGVEAPFDYVLFGRVTTTTVATTPIRCPFPPLRTPLPFDQPRADGQEWATCWDEKMQSKGQIISNKIKRQVRQENNAYFM